MGYFLLYVIFLCWFVGMLVFNTVMLTYQGIAETNNFRPSELSCWFFGFFVGFIKKWLVLVWVDLYTIFIVNIQSVQLVHVAIVPVGERC